MPIGALPQATVRAIGSTSVIADPCSVVKELLDNALDASATSVFIEISPNTVDLIQVKDNGHGIPTDDHPFVCKRAYTSKIQTVDDLRKLGGSSLGFRGEALASAAEISGGVTVITRVDAQLVGSLIKYGRSGDLISTEHSSHPIGTTVRVMDLFKHIPVRRQTTLKDTTKTLGRIKKLIQEYAAAQPSKRLSLKVVKAKNDKFNWMYAPKTDATILDAARKIGGTDTTSTCVVKAYPSPSASSPDGARIDGDLECCVTAVLPGPDTDLSKANNMGQYISVDGRPISAARGIGQDIAKAYKTYLRSAANRSQASVSITDPFLCLHVQCAGSTYDINIEPAKDDVLFEKKESVLELAEGLFRDVYGEADGHSTKPSLSVKGKEPAKQRNGFELLLSQASASSTPPTITAASRPRTENFKPFRSPMPLTPGSSSRVSREPTSGPSALTGYSHQASIPLHDQRQGELRSNTPNTTFRRPSLSPCLPSPSTSSSRSISTSPINPSSSGTTLGFSQPSPSRVLDAKRASRERDRERYGNGSLDTWFGKTTQVALSRMTAGETPTPEDEERSLTQIAKDRFGPAEEVSPGQSASGGQPNQLIELPLNPENFPSAKSASLSDIPLENTSSGAPDKRLDHWSYRIHQLFKAAPQPGLEEALDFENRKKEAIQQRREQMRSRLEQPAPSSSPHHSRYLAARAALNDDQAPSSSESALRPVLNPHDPRAYLMRQLGHQSNERKNSRTNTNKLPLEKIPQGQELYGVGLTQPNDLFSLGRSFIQTSKTDQYTQSGDEFEGFNVSDSESDIIASWTSRLSSLIKSHYRSEAGSELSELRFDFSSFIQPHVLQQ